MKFIKGSIFDSKADCLVNPVNCVGVMGKGLALEFKKKFPDMFQDYSQLCKNGRLKPGTVSFWYGSKLPIICLFPTKNHWRNPSTVDIIDTGLKCFVDWIGEYPDIQSVAFPKLGCGLGGLDWDSQVRPLFEKHLESISLDIEVYI